MTVIEFNTDRINVRGPKSSDNSYVVTLELGEYNQKQAVELLSLPVDQVYKVTVEPVHE